MAQRVRGVVAPAKDAPVRAETVVVPDPGPGEALVEVRACGVCHTDLHYPLVDLYRRGRLDLDAFVSETIPLDGVAAAFDRMRAGDVLRSVVVL